MFSQPWKNFTEKLRKLFFVEEDEIGKQQFLEFRDKVYAFVQGERFLSDLDLTPNLEKEIVDILIAELDACSRAAEIASIPKKKEERKKRRNEVLQAGKTATSSMRVVFKEIPYVNMGLKFFEELCDIWKD